LSATLVNEILGNIASFPVGSRTVERIPIASDDLARRLLRVHTARGDLGLRLEAGQALRDGDVVYADVERVVCLEVAPDDVLVARPRSIDEALTLGHALGNRHLPAHIGGGEIAVRYDSLVAELFAECGVPYVRERRKLSQPFRHVRAPHAHDP
jgi:urease accessory protein